MTDAEKWQAVVVLLDHTEKVRDGMTIHGFYQAIRVLVYQAAKPVQESMTM